MYLITLNKENIALAISELKRTLKPKKYTLYEDFLLIENPKFKKADLGLTKSIDKVLALSGSINNLKIKLGKLKKYVKGSFKVEASNYKEKHDEIIKIFSSLVTKSLKNPKVDVKNPDTLLKCIKIGSKHFFVKERWKNEDSAKRRENKELPEKMPTTLNPRIAKAMINLTGLKKGKILDPFCGAGGILIEAARKKFKVTGYDIDKRAIGKARINLKHLNLKANLKRKDALELDKKFKAIVTDVPFGKNSKLEMNIKKLCSKFLKKALKYTKIIIIGMPADIPKDVIPKKWNIVNFFDIYIHKSMTKRIYILERK